MSPRDSTDRPGSSRRAKPDVYTTMLAVAVVALLVAIVLLVLEWSAYDFDTSAGRLHNQYAAQQTALAGVMPQAISRQTTDRHEPSYLRAADQAGAIELT